MSIPGQLGKQPAVCPNYCCPEHIKCRVLLSYVNVRGKARPLGLDFRPAWPGSHMPQTKRQGTAGLCPKPLECPPPCSQASQPTLEDLGIKGRLSLGNQRNRGSIVLTLPSSRWAQMGLPREDRALFLPEDPLKPELLPGLPGRWRACSTYHQYQMREALRGVLL